MSLKIENIETYGWEAAIRGMRNPKNSWSKTDSYWGLLEDKSPINPNDEVCFFVGENDLGLMKTLAHAGTDHGKFLRMITVTMDITAPLYWWKEFDTYKVGTVANSCSTMHKIMAKEFTLDDFSHEHLTDQCREHLQETINLLNAHQFAYIHTNTDVQQNCTRLSDDSCAKMKKDIWWQIIQLLPSSYNQKRTVQLNYAVCLSIYNARRNHKLDEWHTLCDTIRELPYFTDICLDCTQPSEVLS